MRLKGKCSMVQTPSCAPTGTSDSLLAMWSVSQFSIRDLYLWRKSWRSYWSTYTSTTSAVIWGCCTSCRAQIFNSYASIRSKRFTPSKFTLSGSGWSRIFQTRGIRIYPVGTRSRKRYIGIWPRFRRIQRSSVCLRHRFRRSLRARVKRGFRSLRVGQFRTQFLSISPHHSTPPSDRSCSKPDYIPLSSQVRERRVEPPAWV